MAEEVRSLAQKSAGASAETADIIEKNKLLTDTSRTAAEKVMTVAQSNAKSLTELDELITEISAASEEQRNGIKEINISMSQMEEVTQDNAASAQENTAASNIIREQISNLKNSVSAVR